jgi:competence protein ComFC
MLHSLRDPLLSLIYPQECRVCGRRVKSVADGVACDACWASTSIFDGSERLCTKCGAFFNDGPALQVADCPHCREHQYENAFAIGIYERALSASIIDLKSTPRIPTRLNDLVCRVLAPLEHSDIDLIIPMPLSKQRRLERGFNQADVIAAAASRAIRVPVDAFSLERRSHTAIHRVGMDRRARELSVQHAFKVARPKLIKGKKVLLVDDVLTSGATASYCAQALKKAGAAGVNVFTLARAVLR